MLKRAYSSTYHAKKPSYVDSSVCEEWHERSIFTKWAKSQDSKGKQLDKDILKPGNRVYGPEYCVFVTSEVNNLVQGHRKGKYLEGVCLNGKAYSASYSGKHLGCFSTELEAHKAHISAKAERTVKLAMEQSDSRVTAALLSRAYKLVCMIE